MTVRVLNGDCRDVLRTLPAGSADACITDPPYGDTSLEWDRKCAGWLPEIARVLRPTSSLWVFGSLRFLVPLIAEAEQVGFGMAQDIVWEKQNGTGFHADRFRRVHEHAVHLYRGRWSDLYKAPQFTPDAVARAVRRKRRPTHLGHIEAGAYVSEDGGPRLMRSVLAVRNEHGRAVHPTQKPIGIVEPLILYSVPPGGLLIDPFAGSGTMGMAAKRNARDAILIELNPEYADMARRRVTDDAPLFAEIA